MPLLGYYDHNYIDLGLDGSAPIPDSLHLYRSTSTTSLGTDVGSITSLATSGAGSTATWSGVVSDMSGSGVFGTSYYYTIVPIYGGVPNYAQEYQPGPLIYRNPPGATGFVATGVTLAVNMSWTADADATYYQILRGTSSSTITTAVGQTTGTTFSDTTGTPGTTYYYKVVSFYQATSTPQPSYNPIAVSQPTATATPLTVAAPNPPTSPYATAGNNQASLSWTASTTTATSPAIRYSVYRGTATGAETTLVASNLTSTAYTNTGLTNGTAYYYVIKATDRGSVSAASSEVTATPVAPPAPAAPTGLTASVAGGNLQVALSWTGVSGVGTYRIERALVSGGPYTAIGAAGGTTYTDYNVVAGTTYYYVVVSDGNGTTTSGYSVPSNEASATPTGPPPPTPTAPQNLVAFGRVSSVYLTWNPPSNANLDGLLVYNVYRGTTAGGESATALPGGVSVTNFTDTTAVAGTTYYYVVKATGGTQGPASNEASATALSFSPNKNNWANGSYPAASTFAAAPQIVDKAAGDATTGYTAT